MLSPIHAWEDFLETLKPLVPGYDDLVCHQSVVGDIAVFIAVLIFVNKVQLFSFDVVVFRFGGSFFDRCDATFGNNIGIASEVRQIRFRGIFTVSPFVVFLYERTMKRSSKCTLQTTQFFSRGLSDRGMLRSQARRRSSSEGTAKSEAFLPCFLAET